MPQLLIDTATESPRMLRFLAGVVVQLAAMQEDNGVPVPELIADTTAAAAPKGRPTPPPIRPVVFPAGEPAPLPPGNVPPAPVEHPPMHPEGTPHVPAVPVPADVPAGTTPDVDPSTLGFGQGATAPAAPAAPNAGAPAAVNQTATAPDTASTAATAERDDAGIPWDERIHSETRKRNADGTWRYRRNLDPNVKAAVSAELKARYGSQSQVPLSPSQPVAGVVSGVPVPPAPASVPQQPVAAASVPVPPVPAAGDVPAPPVTLQPSNVLPFTGQPAVPVPPATSVGVPNAPQSPVVPAPVTSFRDLMQKVNTALSQGRLTQAQLTEACKAAGVDSVTALASQPMLVPAVDEYLNRLGVAA